MIYLRQAARARHRDSAGMETRQANASSGKKYNLYFFGRDFPFIWTIGKRRRLRGDNWKLRDRIWMEKTETWAGT